MLLFPGHVFSQTLVQQNVDTRVMLALRVNHKALQQWLPAPWTVDTISTGPSRGANLTLTFIDRLLNEDANGTLLGRGTTRLVVLAAVARHPHTGVTARFDIREFNADPDGVPGPYKTGVLAAVRRKTQSETNALDSGRASEMWLAQPTDSEGIEFSIEYLRGVPSRDRSDSRLHSAVDPQFVRIYRADAGTDVVLSRPMQLDRTRRYELRVRVPELRAVFDGTEQLVSVAVVPWYVRQVFLPR